MNKEKIGAVVMWGVVLLVLMAVTFHACDYFYEKYDIPPDNPIEEAFEDVLDENTGIRLDLSPKSPEKPE